MIMLQREKQNETKREAIGQRAKPSADRKKKEKTKQQQKSAQDPVVSFKSLVPNVWPGKKR